MLNYARQRAIDILKIPQTAVLATNGPAGVQASEFPCEAISLDLYLLVPRTSDHLFNLEHQTSVTLLAAGWELVGEARIIPVGAAGPNLRLVQAAGAEWCVLVKVVPHRMQIRRETGWGNQETIEV